MLLSNEMKNTCIRLCTALTYYRDVTVPTFDWSNSIYGTPREVKPDNAPPALGHAVVLTHYVDANLFHNILSGQHSVTGIIHMINGTPLEFFSKKQATVETAMYGSEFIAARSAMC